MSIPVTRSGHRKALVYALYFNALLLGGILLVLVTRDSGARVLPAAFAAEGPAPIAGGGGIFMMPGQFSVNTWGVYVMDIDQQTLCAYQFYPGDKQLRLVAARNFRYDRRLGNFNTTPAPQEIKELLEKELHAGRVTDQNAAPAQPESPKE